MLFWRMEKLLTQNGNDDREIRELAPLAMPARAEQFQG